MKTISPVTNRPGESYPAEGRRGGNGPRRPVSFDSLPIGAAFRIPQMPRTYVKTGALSYGLHVDEALWRWNEESPFVEVAL